MNIDDDADHRWAGALLSRAVETEPELGFRPEDVLTRARRATTRRRAVLTGAATVVALAAVGLLVGHETAPRSAVQAAGPTVAAKPTETTVYGVEGPLVIDAHSRALTAELAGANPVPPGVRATTDQTYGGQPLVFYKIITGQNTGSYYAQATLTDSHGAGHLVVQVLRTQTGINCVDSTDPRACHTTVFADGARLTVFRYLPPGSPPGKQTIQWMVELVRTNGTAVDVLCGNWNMSGSGGIGTATGFEPPLGPDALTKLAELPDLIP